MSFKSKIAAALAVVTLAGGLAIPTSSAQAGHGWGFVGAGLVGGAIVGSAIAANSDDLLHVVPYDNDQSKPSVAQTRNQVVAVGEYGDLICFKSSNVFQRDGDENHS